MKSLDIQGIKMGEGIPKIIVPCLGGTLEELTASALLIKESSCDIVEWRADHFEGVEDLSKTAEALERIKSILPEKPLLFTFRTLAEGGKRDLSLPNYLNLCRFVAQAGPVDLIDLEFYTAGVEFQKVRTFIKSFNVYVIASSHNFDHTPSQPNMVKTLWDMQNAGADIVKIAVMPRNRKDVLTLMEAGLEFYENVARIPMIALSMAETGLVSRIAPGSFGSAATFGTAGQSSAPGQIEAAELKKFLDIFEQNR